MKMCTKCGARKPLDRFSRDGRLADGVRGKCKECAAEYMREYRARNGQVLRRSLAERPDVRHGLRSTYSNLGCRCDPCRAASAAAARAARAADRALAAAHADATRRHKATHPEYRRRHKAKWQRKVEAASRESATNARKEWTGPQLEIAAREDLTVREIARLLGRSVSAVRMQRWRMKVDPRKINLAGVSR